MSEPVRITPRLPEGWLQGMFAGVEAAILSWLIAALGGLATYVTTVSAPGLGQARWTTAVQVASGWWLTAFGDVITLAEGGVYSLIPLGMTLVTALLLRGSMRRTLSTTPALAAFAVSGFFVTMSALGLVPESRTSMGVVGPLILGVAVALTVVPLPISRIPSWLRAAIRQGSLAFACALGAGFIALVIAVVRGWTSIRAIHDALQPDIVSSIVLVASQLAYLPNAIMWALAYLAGTGFMVGTGTHFTPFATRAEPLPAIPILGALPEPGNGPGWSILLVLVSIGALLGALRAWRAGDRGPIEIARELAIALPTLYVLLIALNTLSVGSLGPGRMAETGMDAPIAALAAMGLLGAGLAAGLFARLGLKAAGMVDSVESVEMHPGDSEFFGLEVEEAEPVAELGWRAALRTRAADWREKLGSGAEQQRPEALIETGIAEPQDSDVQPEAHEQSGASGANASLPTAATADVSPPSAL